MISSEFMEKIDSGMKVAFYKYYHDPNNPLNIIRDAIDEIRRAERWRKGASKDK